jgi:hypothetical protein
MNAGADSPPKTGYKHPAPKLPGETKMEIIPYLMSVLLCLLVFRWNWANSRRKPGESVQGLFRYPDSSPPMPPAAAGKDSRTGRARRLQQGGMDQAAALTRRRTCCFSNGTGPRQPTPLLKRAARKALRQ